MLNVDHPANRGVISYLGDPQRLARSVSAAASRTECTPADIPDPYYTLGTHPDLVTRLWDELAHELPVDCRCVVFGTPALVRPDSGVLFGFAGGPHTYALRLPPALRASACRQARQRSPILRTRPRNQHQSLTSARSAMSGCWVGGLLQKS